MNRSKPNIVLIVLDTVRYDVLSESISTGDMPYLAKLKNDFNFFHDCIAPSPWTVPSHASLFTGKYPSYHNVHEDNDINQFTIVMNKIIDYPGNTLTESLKNLGYSTYGFVANPYLMPGTGFERGFDFLSFSDMFSDIFDAREKFKVTIRTLYPNNYEDIINLANNFSYSRLVSFIRYPQNIMKIPLLTLKYSSFIKEMKKSGYPVFKAGSNISYDIFNSHLNEPFFLFVNFMEAHDPYILANGELFSGEASKMLRFLSGDLNLNKKLLELYKKLYKEELKLLDGYIEKIIKFLFRIGCYDDTVIVITSDHGQCFGEDHFYGHGILLLESLLRVPLLVKLPDQELFGQPKGYQSLVNVHKFLLQSGKGIIAPDLLSSEYVFAESFGIQEDYRTILKGKNDIIQKLSMFDKRKLAVYYKNHKFSLNFENDSVYYENHGPNSEIINKIILEFLGEKYKIRES